MSLDLNSIPGYRETVERASALRETSFLGVQPLICGVPVMEMTPLHYATLDLARSPFLHRQRIPSAGDIALFLWVLSPKYVVGNSFLARWKRRRFTVGLRKLNAGICLIDIEQYLDDQLQDQQGYQPTKKEPIAVAGFCACLVHRLATVYGWSEQEIVNTPIIRLLQYRKLIGLDNGVKITWNPGDKERGEFLRQLNQQSHSA